MSRQKYPNAGVLCLRCAYYGIRTPPASQTSGTPGASRLYCQDCADRIDTLRMPGEGGPGHQTPRQITHYDKEAT